MKLRLNNKRILVTGANGFIGGHLCRALREQGARVVELKRENINILDVQRVKQFVWESSPEYVVHLAASRNKIACEMNFQGTINVVEACETVLPFTRFVFLGSCAEYGKIATPFEEANTPAPVEAYGITKLVATRYLESCWQNNRFPSVILRPTVVYGPGQRSEMFLPALIQSLIGGEPFSASQGEQTRDFVYVEDVVKAILATIDNNHIDGKVINISSGESISLRHVAMLAAKLIGPEKHRLIQFGTKDYRIDEVMDYCASNARAREWLSWSPAVSLEDGLRRTIKSFL